jgi:DNA-directed RNA polymerase specialized sigma24 family protein
MATNARISPSFPGVPLGREWLETLVDAHGQRIYAMCHWMSAEESEATSLAENIFVECINALPTDADASAAAEELDQILVSVLSARFLRPTPVKGAPDAPPMGIAEGVRALAPSERLQFLMHDVAGYAPEKIASLMDLDERECRRTIFSARMKLRHAIN